MQDVIVYAQPQPHLDNKLKLAPIIRKIRVRMGLTMIEFAIRLGVTQSSLSRYEAGKATPGGQVIFALMQLASPEEKREIENALNKKVLPEEDPEDPFNADNWVVKAVFQPGETFISQRRREKAQQEQLDQLRRLADRVLPKCDGAALALVMSMLTFIESRPMLGTIAAGAPVESFPPAPEEEMDQRSLPVSKKAKR